jgi:hypothetical protein
METLPMEAMTLRAAAERSARSITTLRRYIRSGRLKAEKRPGRFGPEYYVLDSDLDEAGFPPAPGQLERLPAPSVGTAVERAFRESVPLTLYHELQLKHEQLLVQYGMFRAAGLRALELQTSVESKEREIEECRGEIASLRERLVRESGRLERQIREAELELEGRGLEIEALREKVRGLELLTRNAVTTESIERQFAEVMEQANRVDRLRAGEDATAHPSLGSPDLEVGPDH